MKRTKKGFTLVELVIVIAVIAILAAVLIPTFSNVISDSRTSSAALEVRNAISAYNQQNPEALGEGNDYVIVYKVSDDVYRYYTFIDGVLAEVRSNEDGDLFDGAPVFSSNTVGITCRITNEGGLATSDTTYTISNAAGNEHTLKDGEIVAYLIPTP